MTDSLQNALTYADNIIATLREPFVVLDKSLRVRTANAAFYVSKEETEGRFVFDLGNSQWDIPQLRTLLPQVLSDSHPVEGFQVEHALPRSRTKKLATQRPPVPSQTAMTRNGSFWPSRTILTTVGRKPP